MAHKTQERDSFFSQTGIIQSIPSIVSAAGDAVRQAASAFTSYDWGSIGTNIINGIKNGISNAAGRIADAAKDAAKKAFDAAKNFLGIESPSKLFRDEVGRYISEGIAVGIEQDDSPSKAIEKSVKSTLRHAQTVNIDGISAGRNTSNSADRILAVLERYLPECAETDVYLGDKLVSEVNRSLGMKARFA